MMLLNLEEKLRPGRWVFVYTLIFAIFSCTNPKPVREADPHPNEIVALKLKPGEQITIDGKLEEEIYLRAPHLGLVNSQTLEKITDPAYAASAQIYYDESYLYVAFACHDRDIHTSFTERDQYLWEEEAVEVFIDIDDQPNDYVEIEISPKNILYDSFIVDPVNIDVEETLKYNLHDIQHAVHVVGSLVDRSDKDELWSVEIAIPFSEIVPDFDARKLLGAQWKINFYRLNLDDHGPRAFAWQATQGSFHQPAKFGTLYFE